MYKKTGLMCLIDEIIQLLYIARCVDVRAKSHNAINDGEKNQCILLRKCYKTVI